MLLNTQPIEKRERLYGGTVDVHSIFYTIQGEGPFAGTPAVFVRLAGCNLQCPLCDTEYTDTRVPTTPEAIIKQIEDHCKGRTKFVVLTGGEPFRQQVGDLLVHLLLAGYYVQVETNGTLAPPEIPHYEVPFKDSANYPAYAYSINFGARRGVYVVCSPKSGKVNAKLAAVACCFKYVAQAGDISQTDGLPLSALGHKAHPYLARPPEGWDRPIYIQPADEQDEETNAANTTAVVESAMEHGYVVQLQIHKLLGME
jgi:7-carboxy-7-deazaguanine synthase